MSNVSINSFAQSLACLSYAKSTGAWLEDDAIDHLGGRAYEDASNLVCEVAGADDNAIDVNAFRVGRGRVDI